VAVAAFFDVDGTLIAKNSGPLYMKFLRQRGEIRRRDALRTIYFYVRYRLNLLDIELLTIKIRLLVVSVDKAQEMGIDWWRNDPMLNSRAQDLEDENRALRERLQEIEGPQKGEKGSS